MNTKPERSSVYLGKGGTKVLELDSSTSIHRFRDDLFWNQPVTQSPVHRTFDHPLVVCGVSHHAPGPNRERWGSEAERDDSHLNREVLKIGGKFLLGKR